MARRHLISIGTNTDAGHPGDGHLTAAAEPLQQALTALVSAERLVGESLQALRRD